MKRCERFQLLLKGERIYMTDFLATTATEARLKQHFDISTERELLDVLRSDFYYLSTRDISQNESYFKCCIKRPHFTEGERICPFGIRWHRGAYESKFTVDEAIEGPLENVSTPNEILAYKFPEPGDFDFYPLLKEAEENKDRIRIGGLWSGIMGDSYRMYGFQRFMMDIACAPEMIHTLVDKMTDVYLRLNEKYFNTMKNNMEVWFFGNDFGSQLGLLFSPEMWCDFFYKNISKMCSLAHEYGLKVMMHSCGGIKPILKYLISAGVDIFDPVQTTARGMDPELLADEFGSRLIFHGGLDTQKLLPFGSSEEVKRKSDALKEIFTRKGGYILAPGQVLCKDIPLENILAMYNRS